MKVNRIIFSKIKQQHEILKMKSAYIAAEKAIVQDPSLTQWQQEVAHETVKVDPEMFAAMEVDEFGGMKSLTIKDLQVRELESQIEVIEETGRKLLKEEKYELMQEAKEIWVKLKEQLNNLKNGK